MTGLLAGAAVLAAAWLGWPGVLVGCLLAALRFALSGSSRDAAPAAALAIGLAALMAARAVPPPEATPTAWAVGAGAVRGTVVTAPARGSSWDTFTLEASEAETDGGWTPVAGRVCVVAPRTPPVSLGDRIWLAGEATSIEDEPARIKGMMNARGCGASLFARVVSVDAPGSGWRRSVASARDRFSATIQSLAPGDAGALMSGLVTGADDALSRERKDAFLATGTTHITAVSGSNFATLVTVLLAAGGVAGLRRNRLWLGVAVAGVWAYAVFVGLEAPALRAALAASGAVFAAWAGRRPDVVTLNVIAAALMALAVPEIVWGLGFQLSLVASVALAASASMEAATSPAALIAPALAATGIAQIATLPLLLPLRGDLPLASLPANLVIGPLVALAFPLSAAAGLAGLAWMPAGDALALPATLAANGIIWSVDWFAALGGTVMVGEVRAPAAVIIGLGAGLACFALSGDGQRAWAQWPGRRARMGPLRQALAAGAMTGIAAAIFGALVLGG